MSSDLREKDVEKASTTGSPEVQESSKDFHENVQQPDDAPIIVDWDRPDDPKNPKNWTTKRKWTITLVASAITLVTPVSSAMIAPGKDQMAASLGIESSVETAMAISVFVLAYAVGPLLIGPLSEIFGRLRVLLLANLFFLVWNLVCGFAKTPAQIIVFRLLAGMGGSAPLAVGGGLLGDIWRPEERGKAIGVFLLAPLLGPVLGPLTGAWILDKVSWRWVFWATSIADGVVQVFCNIYLTETYPPVLLERKANALRKANPGKKYQTVFSSTERTWQKILARSMIRPAQFFTTEPITVLMGLFQAVGYGTMYIFLTTMAQTFQDVYHQSVGIAGLHFLALGLGMSGATQISGWTMDGVYRRLSVRYGDGKGKPEYRLPMMIPGAFFMPIGLFIAGWTSRPGIPWIVPDIGIFILGLGTVFAFMVIQAYIIDTYTIYAASALAAVDFLRALAGFGFPLFAPRMYSVLGYGKADTILACAAIATGFPMIWFLWTYGERIRSRSEYARS